MSYFDAEKLLTSVDAQLLYSWQFESLVLKVLLGDVESEIELNKIVLEVVLHVAAHLTNARLDSIVFKAVRKC